MNARKVFKLRIVVSVRVFMNGRKDTVVMKNRPKASSKSNRCCLVLPVLTDSDCRSKTTVLQHSKLAVP